MIVVTSGKKYIDIDAYASCVVYRDLLRLLGGTYRDGVVVLPKMWLRKEILERALEDAR